MLFSASHPNRHLVVLALAAACLAAGCRSGTPAAPPISSDTWAVVDGRNIMAADVEKVFQRDRDASVTLSEEETLGAKLGLLDDLVTQDILLAKARELMIDVPQTEIDTAFTETKQNLEDAAFQEALKQRNLTEDDVRESLRRDLLVQKLMEREVVAKVSVPDQEVVDFYNANRAQFNLPEDAVRLGQIVVTPVRDAQAANRRGDDATTPEAAREKIAMLMQRLQAGEQFAELAMDYSEDPESAPRGGDLGLVPLSAVRQAQPALRDAVLAMQPGNARIVNQNGAQVIVLMVSREQAGQRDLDTPGTRDQITQALRTRKEQLLRAAYVTALRAEADVTNYLARRLVDSNGKL